MATVKADDDEYTSGSESGSGSGSEYTDSGETGSSSEGDTGSGSEGETDSGSEDDESGSDSDESDDDEPQLKYHRLGASVTDILSKQAATSMAASGKFLVLGTDYGNIYVLDSVNGTEAMRFLGAHAERVNDISIDRYGDFIASCADDGKVVIRSLYDKDNVVEHAFNRPVKSVAIDPEYSKNKKKQFCTGGLAGELVLNEKTWGIFATNKKKVLHSGEGPIYAIRWRGIFIAWANNLGVKIYDTSSQQRISFIKRDKDSPRPDLYACRLIWKDDTTLLIGWAASLKVGVIKEKEKGAAGGATGSGLPSRYMELIAMFNIDDARIAGIAPFGDNLVVLTYSEADEDDLAKGILSERPELYILTLRKEELTTDILSIQNYEKNMCNDYILNYLQDDNLFYVVSPKDIVVAKPCDLDDHITWLHERERFQDAMIAAEGNEKMLRTHTMLEIQQKYLADLLGRRKYDEAAKNCPIILGTDVSLWEKWVCSFAKLKQLKPISPYIPIDNPRLGSTVYEMVLNSFLQSDVKEFQQTIRDWPPVLYNNEKIIPAVKQRLKKTTDEEESSILNQTLAELHTRAKQFDKALAIYLMIGHGDVFELIDQHDLFHSIQDKIFQLMKFDQKKAIKLLVHNVKQMKPDQVVDQLKGDQEYQYLYLDELSRVDPHAAKDFGPLQVELTATLHPERLMNYLRSNTYVPLRDAFEICEDRGLTEAQVFLLQRMGDTKRALMLIIEKLGNVDQAIQFAMEENDEEIWDELIRASMDKPEFIKGLLDNVGTHINPIRLISSIRRGLEIPGLQASLVKILQDYNLQKELRKGCETILTSDSVLLLRRLNGQQKRAMSINVTTPCVVCRSAAADILGKADKLVAFRCGHLFHDACLMDQITSIRGTSAGPKFCALCRSAERSRRGGNR